MCYTSSYLWHDVIGNNGTANVPNERFTLICVHRVYRRATSVYVGYTIYIRAISVSPIIDAFADSNHRRGRATNRVDINIGLSPSSDVIACATLTSVFPSSYQSISHFPASLLFCLYFYISLLQIDFAISMTNNKLVLTN